MITVPISRRAILDALQKAMEDKDITFKDIARIWDDFDYIVEDLGLEKAKEFANKILEACNE